jgi:hypothetical protein
MEIIVDRFVSDHDSTVSRILIDGQFMCFGLEDEYRAEKVAHETRIPAGTYAIKLRTEGGFHQRYKEKFPNMHRGMLHVQDVPGFEYILIHIGNTDKDTAGCLLVGEQAVTTKGDMRVNMSKVAYERLYPAVVDAAAAGALRIRYLDNDRP